MYNEDSKNLLVLVNSSYQILPVDNKKIFTKYVIIKNKLKQEKSKKIKRKKQHKEKTSKVKN